jgi:hypothetical protein
MLEERDIIYFVPNVEIIGKEYWRINSALTSLYLQYRQTFKSYVLK